MEQHYHKAKRDKEGKLLRECDECGEDLMHKSHIKIKPKGTKIVLDFGGEEYEMMEDFV